MYSHTVLYFFELEDTVKEAYNAIRQMESKAFKLAFITGDWMVIAAPIPIKISQALAPIIYVFNETAKRGIFKREFWLLQFEKNRIIRIIDDRIGSCMLSFKTISEEFIRLKSDSSYMINRNEANRLLLALKNL